MGRGPIETLQSLGSAGLEELKKRKLRQFKRNQSSLIPNAEWAVIYAAVADACKPKLLPDSLSDCKKLKLTYHNAFWKVKRENDDEPDVKTTERLFEKLLAAPTVPTLGAASEQYDPGDLQHLMSWRSLYPAGSQLTALMLIGLLAFLTKSHVGNPRATQKPTLRSLRQRYSALHDVPPSKVDASLLPVYTQQMQEQSRANGSHLLEAHARGATLPAGPSHATTGRPPLTPVEKQHPIRFATREAFEPTPELWMHGDEDHRPASIGIPACAHCRSWLFDTESCPACLDGKLVAAFAHKPPGEQMGRFEIVPLSTRHDGPIVTEHQKQYRVYVPFDPAEKAKTTELRKAQLPAEQPW
jgi:hypothetical protein